MNSLHGRFQMRLVLFLSALCLAIPASAQSLIDNYQRLSNVDRQIFDNGRDTYIIHMYKQDGSELRGDEINRKSLLGVLLMINSGCDARALEDFSAHRIAHTSYAVALSKLACTRRSFAKQHLPYTVRLSKAY